MQALIVGCGGIASWLIPPLIAGTDWELILIDGDQVEAKNLIRQPLFDRGVVGKFKAEALFRRYDRLARDRVTSFYTEYLGGDGVAVEQLIEDYQIELVFCCADNHPARKHSLWLADELGCECIIGANEETSAEAYYYTPGAPEALDPRMWYPEIVTDTRFDPLAAVHCNEMSVQTVMANQQAAAHMLYLARLWTSKYVSELAVNPSGEAREIFNNLPRHIRSDMGMLEKVHHDA